MIVAELGFLRRGEGACCGDDRAIEQSLGGLETFDKSAVVLGEEAFVGV